MEIKWERKTVRKGSAGRRITLQAFIVGEGKESSSVEWQTGECLGAVEERFLLARLPDIRAFHQGLFWEVVSRKLDRLNLSPAQREKLESQLSVEIPKPCNDWPLWAVTCIPRFDASPPPG